MKTTTFPIKNFQGFDSGYVGVVIENPTSKPLYNIIPKHQQIPKGGYYDLVRICRIKGVPEDDFMESFEDKKRKESKP